MLRVLIETRQVPILIRRVLKDTRRAPLEIHRVLKETRRKLKSMGSGNELF